jgi:hypothetical protein
MTDEVSKAATKKAPDWERIEEDYRAGVLSIREIAAAHQISHTAIQKRAKRDGWSRDLAAKIQAKADSLVAKEAVASQVATETAATERLIVEANAEAIAQVRLSHRTDIGRARKLCLALLGELEVASEERMTVEGLADALHQLESSSSPTAPTKARDALSRAMSIPARTGSLKALTDSLKTLVGLEREAWDLRVDTDSSAGSAKNVDELSDAELESLIRRARPAPTESETSAI